MNRLTEILQIKYPIIQGGMGNISSSRLAAAVSNAGGLGTIGIGTMPPKEIEAKLLALRNLTSRPFAVNIPITVSPYAEEAMQLAEKYGAAAVSLSAGNPAPYISRLKSKGIKTIAVTASVRQAEKAEASGADIISAEGYEAAGINSRLETTTLSLIPQICSKVNIPVAAAGGISDGRGMASVFMLGASGVQIGTRLIAVKEAPFHENYKNALLDASDASTVIVGRSAGQIRRILHTEYADFLLQKETENPSEYSLFTNEDYHKKGALEGDGVRGFMNAGQTAGLIADIPAVADLFERMMEEAEEAIEKTAGQFRVFSKARQQ
ncbi:NAD(P)H-dependent flavin oxidoreductase [Bacillus infantis]|uniref:NAD(P)H-dependent flavin oxidoreductase n=1 Tax=Bacillus infantis TaxID=324767 RepID=UPI000B9B9BB9|nr:nitronate monooxygenase [Bacillus infantis]MCK6206925.1 nitronate monooxygenase [Bacillus infantis]OXT15889.1 2-nitropropane dioxygenase [Bacillus sp. OG2]